MKKYRILVLSIISALLLPSCGNSWLDKVEPSTDEETEKSLQSFDDVKYTLNGVYAEMRDYTYYGARYTFYGDALGDDMQARTTSMRTANYYLFQFTEETAPSNFWTRPYKMLRNVNRIIAYMGEIDEAEKDDAAKELEGQAYALRALYHFDLARIFGYPYTKDQGASLGAAIMTKVEDKSYKPARNTVAEMYNDVIVPDLIKANNLMPAKSRAKTAVGAMTKYAAEQLLARVYLYMGKDKEAYDTATQAIIDAEANGWQLWTNDEYAGVWEDQGSSEMLFELVITTTEGGSNDNIGYLMNPNGYKDIHLTDDFLDLMSKDKKDVRRQLFNVSKKLTFLKKYPGQILQGEDTRHANVPVLRLSESYLIAAEAAVKQGDNVNATKYLKAIVERANPEATLPATITLDRVLEERRKEFVGEGHRFFDAMRNNKRIERAGKSHLSALQPEAKSFDWNYKKIVMPVPKTEMNSNPNMVQNPY